MLGDVPKQSDAPYLDALRAYADRDPARFHVPGHKGGPGADPGLVKAIGERAVEMDIPALIEGVDAGPDPTAFAQAQALAAEAWGARRTWFITGGASQCNHVACMALAHLGETVVVQRNCHSSTVDALVLSGLRPTFVAPELDPELRIAHCATPAALDDALAATLRSTVLSCSPRPSRRCARRGQRCARSRVWTCSTNGSRARPASTGGTRCGWRSTCAAPAAPATSSTRRCARSTTSTSSCS